MKIIDGVGIEKLVKHSDERGFFMEILRASDSVFEGMAFAQLSHSMSETGVLKAWHLHKKQTDFMYFPLGKVKLGLHDLREDSATKGLSMELILGESEEPILVKIPPGVAHGYKIIVGPAHVIYLMDKIYDPDDIYYKDANDPEIGFTW